LFHVVAPSPDPTQSIAPYFTTPGRRDFSILLSPTLFSFQPAGPFPPPPPFKTPKTSAPLPSEKQISCLTTPLYQSLSLPYSVPLLFFEMRNSLSSVLLFTFGNIPSGQKTPLYRYVSAPPFLRTSLVNLFVFSFFYLNSPFPKFWHPLFSPPFLPFSFFEHFFSLRV